MTIMTPNTRLLKLATSAALVFASSQVMAENIEPPKLDNTAYVLMDYNTGEILAQKNADEPLPPASLTKLMTSYIIEEKLINGELKEDEPVVMSQNAWCGGSSEQSCMYVAVNQSASALDMLKGIVIQSGNDAAVAMAEHIAGSEEAFANMMNEHAKELGMENSHFVNPTGMPAIGHEASARDLAKLAQAIIKKGGKYYDIYAQKEFTFNGIKQGNRNTLLLTDPTVDGLKTGHTNAAGYCLVASSKREDMRLISVIMGTKSMQQRADQSRALLNWGFGHFATKVVAPKGQYVAKAEVWGGKESEVEVVTADTLNVLTTKDQQNEISTLVKLNEDIEAPISKGQAVGKMMAIMDGQTVASVDVIANQNVEQANIVSRSLQGVWRWIKNLF